MENGMRQIRRGIVYYSKIAEINGVKDRYFKVAEMLIEINDKTGVFGEWKFRALRTLGTNDIFTLVNRGTPILNAGVRNKEGKMEIYGTHGSFDRFKTGNELVIISEIKAINEDRVLGYKVMNSMLKVKDMSRRNLINYCIKMKQHGIENPIQNAAFVKDDTIKEGYTIRKIVNIDGDNGGFIEEIRYIKAKKDKIQSTGNIKNPMTEESEDLIAKLKREYGSEQVYIILRARKRLGNRTKVLFKKGLTPTQVKVLASGLLDGIHPAKIAFVAEPKLDADCMAFYVQDLKYGFDIRDYYGTDYNIEQIFQLSLGYGLGLDISDVANPKISAKEMDEIISRKANGFYKEYKVEVEKDK